MDDNTFNVKRLTHLAAELAALVRQYGRATTAGDAKAQEVESKAICGSVRWLLYHHLALRIDMSSDNWVWLNANDENCSVERCGNHDLRVCGRISCSLPESRRDEWTEPFAANLSPCLATDGLSDYTIWFASPATMLDLATLRRLIASGEVVNPRAPDREEGWAFEFRMREHV